MSLLVLLVGFFIGFYGMAMDSLGISASGIAVMALALYLLQRPR